MTTTNQRDGIYQTFNFTNHFLHHLLKSKIMSNVKTNVIIEGKIYVELTEGEARALEAIVGYGPDEFVKWFYRNLGKHYLQPHENHTRSLFETLRHGLSRELSK